MTLTEFIRARLDEDEAAARAADVKQADPEWYAVATHPALGGHKVRSRRDNRPIARVEDLAGGDDEDVTSILDGRAASEHIARHDPARVLREVDAHRMLIEDHSGRHVCEDNMAGTVWDEEAEDIVEDPCRVLRIIGSIYADHPDYRTDWQVQP